MIEHVRRRALLSGVFDQVFVATGDKEIALVVRSYGGNVIQTHKLHHSGTSRLIEAASNIDADHIVLIQGDEPLILPIHLQALTNKIYDFPNVDAWNATASLTCEEQLDKHSIVKCISNQEGKILFCFRKTPSFSNFEIQSKFIRKILGLIAFKKKVLMGFENYDPSIIERSESIEQLRLIEKGFNFRSVPVEPALPSINEPGDIEEVLEYISNRPLQKDLLDKVLQFI